MKGVTIGKCSYGEVNRKGTHNKIYIGNYCSIAEGVIFDGGFKHNTKSVSTYPFHRLYDVDENIDMRGDIYIGNDVYIGQEAIIMSGIRIGDGAVVGARSIVTRNVAPYEVVIGAPLEHLRFRFDQKQICKLLKIEWWSWDDEKIEENVDLLQNNDIDKFIDLHCKH